MSHLPHFVSASRVVGCSFYRQCQKVKLHVHVALHYVIIILLSFSRMDGAWKGLKFVTMAVG